MFWLPSPPSTIAAEVFSGSVKNWPMTSLTKNIIPAMNCVNLRSRLAFLTKPNFENSILLFSFSKRNELG